MIRAAFAIDSQGEDKGKSLEFVAPFHDVLVVGLLQGSNSVRLTVPAAKSEDYTTERRHLKKPNASSLMKT